MSERNYDWTNVDMKYWNKHHMYLYIHDQHRDLPSTAYLSFEFLLGDGKYESASWQARFAAVYKQYTEVNGEDHASY